MSVIIENNNEVKHWFQYVELSRYENILPDGTYYYIEINPGTQVDIKKKRHAADNVLGTNKILLIDNMLEGLKTNIPFIYEEFVIKKNVPEEQIFLLSGAADVKEFVEEYALQFNRKPIQCKYVLFFANSLMNDVKYQRNYLIDRAFLDEKYRHRIFNHSRTYLNLNRRWRPHRVAMTAMLYDKNLIDKGYVSLTDAGHGSNIESFNYDAILDEHENDIESYVLLETQKSSLPLFTRMSLDRQSLVENEAHLSDDIEKYYWDSAINLTSETNFYTKSRLKHDDGRLFYEPARFLSEKTFKPMLYLQPFIMISVPKTLELLRNLGFKTFHPYINESYDVETDPIKRFSLIEQEIKKLNYSSV